MSQQDDQQAALNKLAGDVRRAHALCKRLLAMIAMLLIALVATTLSRPGGECHHLLNRLHRELMTNPMSPIVRPR